MSYTKEEKQKAIEYLLEYLKEGDKVYTIVTHVSKSGMSRSIKCLFLCDGSILDRSHLVAKVFNLPLDKSNGGVKVRGCGMDMGWALVEDHLSYELFQANSKIKQVWI